MRREPNGAPDDHLRVQLGQLRLRDGLLLRHRLRGVAARCGRGRASVPHRRQARNRRTRGGSDSLHAADTSGALLSIGRKRYPGERPATRRVLAAHLSCGRAASWTTLLAVEQETEICPFSETSRWSSGIAGGSGSGKTTVAKNLRDGLPGGECVLIEHDWYYLDRSHLTAEPRATPVECAEGRSASRMKALRLFGR